MDTSNCSEFKIFESAILWANAECGRRNIVETNENIIHVLGDAFSKVRFGFIEALGMDVIGRDYVDLIKYGNTLKFSQTAREFKHIRESCLYVDFVDNSLKGPNYPILTGGIAYNLK